MQTYRQVSCNLSAGCRVRKVCFVFYGMLLCNLWKGLRSRPRSSTCGRFVILQISRHLTPEPSFPEYAVDSQICWTWPEVNHHFISHISFWCLVSFKKISNGQHSAGEHFFWIVYIHMKFNFGTKNTVRLLERKKTCRSLENHQICILIHVWR
jgi:hypothetical protein